MEITPIDILHVQFKPSLRGYRRVAVDEFLRKVAATMETVVQERADLKDKLGKLEAEVRHCQELEKSMHNALILAQKTADELKANAHREADLIVREAEQTSAATASAAREELVSIKAELQALKEQRGRFETEFRSLVRSCSDWLESQSNGRRPAGEDS